MEAEKKSSQKDSILQAAKAARTYTQEIAGRSISLMLPSKHDSRIAYILAGANRNDPAVLYRMLREELKMAIVGWSNITVDDLLKNGDTTLVDFDPELVSVMLDAQDDWRKELDEELSRRVAERDGSLEAAQKNS